MNTSRDCAQCGQEKYIVHSVKKPCENLSTRDLRNRFKRKTYKQVDKESEV